MVATVTAAKQDKSSEENKDEDYSDLWDVEPFDQSNYWFLKTGNYVFFIDLPNHILYQICFFILTFYYKEV